MSSARGETPWTPEMHAKMRAAADEESERVYGPGHGAKILMVSFRPFRCDVWVVTRQGVHLGDTVPDSPCVRDAPSMYDGCWLLVDKLRPLPSFFSHPADRLPFPLSALLAASRPAIRPGDGRAAPPTDAEIAAHAAAGGAWWVRAEWRPGRQFFDFVQPWAPQIARLLRDEFNATWWVALDADRAPCAWPVATAEAAQLPTGGGS